jgi:serine/threonine protein kinase
MHPAAEEVRRLRLASDATVSESTNCAKRSAIFNRMSLGEYEIRGDETGRGWRTHIARQLPLAGSGERRKGQAADGEDVLLHTLRKEEMYADDLARARVAIDIARRPEIRTSPVIVRLVDTSDDEHALTLVWEWAEVALHELLQERAVTASDASGIDANVHAALATLHELNLVHCDVAPNNVLRVGGTWKLGDLDSVRPRGQPLDRFPPDRYRHPDAVRGARAEPAHHLHGLDQIAARL